MAQWMLYVGFITGCVGAITGITGSILGYKAYRRTGKYKALDLRVQLEKEIRALSLDLQALLKAIPAELQSRRNVNSAIGMGRSGAEQEFIQAAEADLKRCADFESNLEGICALTNRDDADEIEHRLVEAHGIRVETDQLATKYRQTRADDDATRDRIARSAGRRPPS
jgi:hypothetical protein